MDVPYSHGQMNSLRVYHTGMNEYIVHCTVYSSSFAFIAFLPSLPRALSGMVIDGRDLERQMLSLMVTSETVMDNFFGPLCLMY